jgi:hypothetical protein
MIMLIDEYSDILASRVSRCVFCDRKKIQVHLEVGALWSCRLKCRNGINFIFLLDLEYFFIIPTRSVQRHVQNLRFLLCERISLPRVVVDMSAKRSALKILLVKTCQGISRTET